MAQFEVFDIALGAGPSNLEGIAMSLLGS